MFSLLRIYLYNHYNNTERYATSDMADTKKTSIGEERVAKKAARRAAFIQEVAEATLNEQALRGLAANLRVNAERHLAEVRKSTAKQIAEAEFESERPLDALFKKECPSLPESNTFVRSQEQWQAYRLEKMFDWAIEKGILPADIQEWPDREGQFKALARWQSQTS